MNPDPPVMMLPARPGSVLDNIRQWRSLSHVHFIETQVFTKQITSLLDEAEYRQLQVTLALKPRAGDIIRGSGGLRKIRWSVRGRGKSGGIRIIYYLVADEEIYFLFAYAKNKQEDLDNVQLRILRNLVREEFK
jgi:mRNA-degrading endonuclease RelE of RelBE toxin-antitoxin system